jgi:hypothetical protein
VASISSEAKRLQLIEASVQSLPFQRQTLPTCAAERKQQLWQGFEQITARTTSSKVLSLKMRPLARKQCGDGCLGRGCSGLQCSLSPLRNAGLSRGLPRRGPFEDICSGGRLVVPCIGARVVSLLRNHQRDSHGWLSSATCTVLEYHARGDQVTAAMGRPERPA